MGEIPDVIKTLPPQCKHRIAKYIPAYSYLLDFLGFPRGKLTYGDFMDAHTRFGNIRVVKLSYDASKDHYHHGDTSTACAAESGSIEMVKLIGRFSGVMWSSEANQAAAKHGHLELLKWAYSKCYYVNRHLSALSAIEGGHLDVLKWLRSNEYGWNITEYIATAVVFKQPHIEKWIRETGDLQLCKDPELPKSGSCEK